MRNLVCRKSAIAGLLVCFSLCLIVSVQGDDGRKKEASADAKAGDNAKEKGNKEKTEKPFAHIVREDFFAGFAGNDKALEKAIKYCEETLKKHPKHAEALAWKGAGGLFLSGKHFQSGDVAKGLALWQSSVAELDKAKELEPDNVGVLIPRAAAMMGAGRNAPEEFGKPLLIKVKADFEHVYEDQKEYLDQIGEHPLGELRMGLADVYRLLGEADKSKEHLLAVQKELPETEYAKRATEWLAAPADKKLAHNCIGCHSP